MITPKWVYSTLQYPQSKQASVPVLVTTSPALSSTARRPNPLDDAHHSWPSRNSPSWDSIK